MKFSELKLHKDVAQGIQAAGFDDCTLIQEKVFPLSFSGKDLYVQSQTGSGKTAAYLITVFQRLMTEKGAHRKALIIAPTREQARRIEFEAKKLGKYLPFSIGSIFGGVRYGRQEKMLKDGLDIVVGTPGRLLDFEQKNKLVLSEVAVFVIDEADRLFEMGFLPDVRRMINKMPPHRDRQTMLFCAGPNYYAQNLVDEYMHNPEVVQVDSRKISTTQAVQELYQIDAERKLSLLLGLLKREKPHNSIIFANSKQTVIEITQRLEMNGQSSEYIIGELPQSKRSRVVDSVQSGQTSVLVATDEAIRSLRIGGVSLIVNYDLPENADIYLERNRQTVGPTSTGTAITLVSPAEQKTLAQLLQHPDIHIETRQAGNSLFVEDHSAIIVSPARPTKPAKPASQEARKPQNQQPAANKPRRHTQPARVVRPEPTPAQQRPRRHTVKQRPQPVEKAKKRAHRTEESRKPILELIKREPRKVRTTDYKIRSYDKFVEPVAPPEEAPPEQKSILKRIFGIFKKQE